MQYILMIYGNEGSMAKMTQKDGEQMHAAYGAYTEALKKAGVMVGGDRLHASTDASTVRMNNGKAKVLNGPYAESKEIVGGFFIITAKDYDEACTIARGCPHLKYYGRVEVRQIEKMG